MSSSGAQSSSDEEEDEKRCLLFPFFHVVAGVLDAEAVDLSEDERSDWAVAYFVPINVTATAEALSSGCWRGVSARSQYLVLGRVTRPQHVEADALVDWTPETEQLVWAALGWQPWSEWSACSASCGGGVQRRRRACSISTGCQGHDAELRRCNTFSCLGSVDALSLEDRRYFHPARAQWQRVPGRPSAYRLRPNSYIWVPSAQLFPRAGGFPAEFSLLATLRLHPQSTLGTVLSLRSRRQQDAYLSLEVSGDGEGMRLVHAATNGSTQLVALPGLKIQDGRWHHVAIGLHGDHTVRSYLDCRWVSTNILRRNSLDTPQDADVVIGYLFMGDLEQLTVVPSAEAVSEQCDADVALTNDTAPVVVEGYGDADADDDDDDVDMDSTSEEGSGGGSDEDLSDADNDIDTDYQYEVEWSEWSECSASCGTGSQSRFSRCVDDGKRLELCVEAGGERTETHRGKKKAVLLLQPLNEL
ncbi:papilin [Schistocerca americana]|uniref:papilin n=1 Tax=Schistocerca americana TaxID=7009 RepID=UPI001F4FB39E|nr:papilin [Schistocerca americana]